MDKKKIVDIFLNADDYNFTDDERIRSHPPGGGRADQECCPKRWGATVLYNMRVYI